MVNKRLLVVAHYPIKKPLHGGQKRVSALVNFYKKLFKHVQFIAVFHEASYLDFDTDDIPLGQRENLELIDKHPYAVDHIVGHGVDNDAHARAFFAKKIREFNPDIIEIEHPYLYKGLRVLLRELGMHPKIIFSSHNIEHKMKADIYEKMGIKDTTEELIKETRELEEELSRVADLVISVSASDAEWHRAAGAKKVLVAPNGIEKTSASPKALDYWSGFTKRHGFQNIVTFVGSGHPPNYTGFIDMIGSDSGFLPEGAKIVVAGGVAELLKNAHEFKKGKKQSDTFWKNIIPVGIVDEDVLSGLLESSAMIILPITSGGGSNLKTAEAILSGKVVVATKHAFRGFEQYTALPNIYIAESREEFKRLIATGLKRGPVPRTEWEVAIANGVVWENCLRPIEAAVLRLSRRDAWYPVRRARMRLRGLLGKIRHALST